MLHHEELLLAVLNSTPVIEGVSTDCLTGDAGRDLARSWGGEGSAAEIAHVRRVRQALQALIRGEGGTALQQIDGVLCRAVQAPCVTRDGIAWRLDAPDDHRLAVNAVLAWSRVMAEFPGRLRACANDECNLFLVDHSRPGTAKWCSMAVCGNRMKARAYARRSRS